jgi:hypothetical protein
MHRRKKRKSIRKDASVASHRAPYPGRGVLRSQDTPSPAEGSADAERLSFLVELPSRRWLEQAATNSTASP